MLATNYIITIQKITRICINKNSFISKKKIIIIINYKLYRIKVFSDFFTMQL